ncbi:hypothetical protein H5410_004584 [Solanum commersonii]|uniref:Uncharacterized protein n=1 Tax=Solanum commersonii TaxID=4109 RepID=A0A9J6B8E2_SOLCO|nr:hypothetical protein H5410_004584 [Solanum commersonii]
MAPHRDLDKIGSEDFALIDEYFDQNRINRPPTTRDLAKIGSKVFALIDEYFSKKRINRAFTAVVHNLEASAGTKFWVTQQSYHYHYSSPHVYLAIPPIKKEAITAPSTPPVALNSNEAAQLHDGIYLANYSNRRQMHITYNIY